MIKRAIYFPPYDDGRSALLSTLSAAKHTIRVAVFTLTLKQLSAVLVARKQAGVDVQVLLDYSQSVSDAYEAPRIAELRNAGIPVVLGTSSKHNLMHSKFVVIDNKIVISGSYNFTSAAQLENNVLEIEYNSIRAAKFAKAWQDIHDWIVANEPALIS